MAASPILTQGLGSFGSSSLLLTLGYGDFTVVEVIVQIGYVEALSLSQNYVIVSAAESMQASDLYQNGEQP